MANKYIVLLRTSFAAVLQPSASCVSIVLSNLTSVYWNWSFPTSIAKQFEVHFPQIPHEKYVDDRIWYQVYVEKGVLYDCYNMIANKIFSFPHYMCGGKYDV